MLTNYTIKSLESCLPIARGSLYTDVISSQNKGDIHQVWLSAGHVFVSLDGGRRLITFDAKHADFIQTSEPDGCLDLQLDSPILSLLTFPPSAILIILENGKVLLWSYKPEPQGWQQLASLSLWDCEGVSGMSVTLDVTQDILYWCQCQVDGNGQFLYSVHKRKIFWDEINKAQVKLGLSTCLIHHCPLCHLYPVAHGLLLVAKNSKLTFTFLLCTLTGKIELIVGSDRVTVPDVNLQWSVDFRKLLIKCLAYMNKLKQESPLLQTLPLASSQTVVQVYEDGSLISVAKALTDESNPLKRVKLENFQPNGIVGLTHLSGALIVLYGEEIRIHELGTGHCIMALDVLGAGCGSVQGAGQTLLGGHQPVLFTDEDLYIIQKCTRSRQSEDMILLEMSQFQSDAVRLSYIDKMQRYTASESGTGSIEGLRKRWLKDLGIQPSTRLNETVEPFLQQYWYLEQKFRDGINQPEAVPDMHDLTVCEEVSRLLDPMTSMLRSARPTQLLQLSHWYPAQVVSCLLNYFDIGTGELTTSQTHRWQCLLATDTGDTADSSLLEVVCHVLYKYQPDKLLPFLHRGQQVWEKKVGVSAFIRRKQSLLIYERAVKCLPSPQSSINPDAAISVHAHIILVSEIFDCVLKAIRLLLQHKKWKEAIDVLEKNKDNRRYPLFFQMVLGALTQSQVIPQYGDQIFQLMPSVESFMDLGKAGTDEDNQGVMCNDSGGVSIGSVRPYLMASLNTDLEI